VPSGNIERPEEACGGVREGELMDRSSLIPSVMTIGLAALCWLARAGFHSSSDIAVVYAAGLGLWFIHGPWLAQRIFRAYRRPCPLPWCTEVGFLTIAVAVATVAVSAGLATGSLMPAAGVTAVGVGLSFFRNALAWRLVDRWQFLATLALALLATVAIGGIVWGSPYQNPLFLPGMRLGQGSIDTLFQSSISGMIQTYGVPSVGLDGTPYQPYHWGSHVVFAALSRFLGLSPLEFYNLAYPVIFVPWLVNALLVFGASRGALGLGERQCPRRVQISWRFLVLLAAGLLGFLPVAIAESMKQWWFVPYCSESYVLAIGLALLGLAAFEDWVRNASIASAFDRRHWWAACLVFPLLLAAVGLLKLSVMILIGTGGAYVWLRLGLWRQARHTLLLAACGSAAIIAALLATDFVGYVELSAGRTLFHFVRTNVAEPWRGYFLLSHFLWAWLFLSWSLHSRIGQGEHDHSEIPTGRRFLVEETLMVVTALAALPLVMVQWVSVFYFSNVPYWLALALVLRKSLWAENSAPSRHDSWLARFAAMGGPLALAALLGFAVTTIDNVTLWTRQANHINAASRGAPQGPTVSRVLRREGWSACQAYMRSLEEAVSRNHANEAALIAALEELGRLPLAEKRKAAVFVPRSNLVYWALLNRSEDSAFVGPALTGMAMINGVPANIRDLRGRGFGFSVYAARANLDPELGSDMTIDAARARAKRFGYEVLYVIEDDEAEGIRVSRMECSGAAGQP
jgi:hypothetical protein